MFNIDFFDNQNFKMRYGISGDLNLPKRAILALGLSECIEKYEEIACDLSKRGFMVAIMDWPGQGGSSRFLQNLHKRHSKGFSFELDTFHHWIQMLTDHGFFTNAHETLLLGHSMGGHLSLRYLSEYNCPQIKKLALTAPMIDIKIEPPFLKKLAPIIANTACILGLSEHYAPGKSHWSEATYDQDKLELSHDTIRRDVLKKHFIENPALQIGGVTFAWLKEALNSCKILQKEIEAISLPTLTFAAENDMLVNNKTIEETLCRKKNVEYVLIEGAFHEILMESDKYRNKFWESFDRFCA